MYIQMVLQLHVGMKPSAGCLARTQPVILSIGTFLMSVPQEDTRSKAFLALLASSLSTNSLLLYARLAYFESEYKGQLLLSNWAWYEGNGLYSRAYISRNYRHNITWKVLSVICLTLPLIGAHCCNTLNWRAHNTRQYTQLLSGTACLEVESRRVKHRQLLETELSWVQSS